MKLMLNYIINYIEIVFDTFLFDLVSGMLSNQLTLEILEPVQQGRISQNKLLNMIPLSLLLQINSHTLHRKLDQHMRIIIGLYFRDVTAVQFVQLFDRLVQHRDRLFQDYVRFSLHYEYFLRLEVYFVGFCLDYFFHLVGD